MAEKELEYRGRGMRRWIGAIAVGLTAMMLGLTANAADITYKGRKYTGAKVVTSAEFLSIVHDGGIKRIPWDKVPASLKTQYPPPAPKVNPADANEEEEQGGRRRGGRAFGRSAPTVDDLTKRYVSDAEYAKSQWENAAASAKKTKKAEYLEAKKRLEMAVAHYDKMMKRYANDPLAAADNWRKTIGDVMRGRRYEASKAKAAAAAVVKYDLKGKATNAFHGTTYTKKKMKAAVAKRKDAEGGWGGWPIWRMSGSGLSQGNLIWIENVSSIDDSRAMVGKRGGAAQVTLNVVLKKSGVTTLTGGTGKKMRIPMYEIVHKRR